MPCRLGSEMGTPSHCKRELSLGGCCTATPHPIPVAPAPYLQLHPLLQVLVGALQQLLCTQHPVPHHILGAAAAGQSQITERGCGLHPCLPPALRPRLGTGLNQLAWTADPVPASVSPLLEEGAACCLPGDGGCNMWHPDVHPSTPAQRCLLCPGAEWVDPTKPSCASSHTWMGTGSKSLAASLPPPRGLSPTRGAHAITMALGAGEKSPAWHSSPELTSRLLASRWSLVL